VPVQASAQAQPPAEAQTPVGPAQAQELVVLVTATAGQEQLVAGWRCRRLCAGLVSVEVLMSVA
jgi:hypothetical protein